MEWYPLTFSRYWELVPELETARERIKDLEQRLEEASKNLEEQEAKARDTYKKMYEQGKEAAKMEQENVVSNNNNIHIIVQISDMSSAFRQWN